MVFSLRLNMVLQPVCVCLRMHVYILLPLWSRLKNMWINLRCSLRSVVGPLALLCCGKDNETVTKNINLSLLLLLFIAL